MKKLKKIAIYVSSFTLVSVICTNIYAEDSSETPSGDREDGLIITCRCTRDISLKPKSCAVNNRGAMCHASVNAKCWEYNGNCS